MLQHGGCDSQRAAGLREEIHAADRTLHYGAQLPQHLVQVFRHRAPLNGPGHRRVQSMTYNISNTGDFPI